MANSLSAQLPSDVPEKPEARSQVKTEGASPPPDPERNSLLWLHERIITLQRERETRWQKILKLVPGMS